MTSPRYIHEDCEACVEAAQIDLVISERYRQIVDAYIHEYYQNKENDERPAGS